MEFGNLLPSQWTLHPRICEWDRSILNTSMFWSFIHLGLSCKFYTFNMYVIVCVAQPSYDYLFVEGGLLHIAMKIMTGPILIAMALSWIYELLS